MEWKGMKRNCRVTVFGSSPLQWICREWGQKLGSDKATVCFGDERHTESGGPTSQGEGPLARGRECANPSRSRKSLPPVSGPLLLFIPLLCSSSSYTCQLSMPILKCTSPQPFFLALYELLWPPSPCPGVTSTSNRGQGVSCVYLIRKWQLFLQLPPHLFPYG